jgi:ApaG protein
MINNEIRVEIDTHYLPEHSQPGENRFAFAYQISIHNGGDEAARLLSRYWLITDGDGDEQEVRGAGVVGQQPRILPGETYQYTSGAILDTPVGTMEGKYNMEDDSGRRFDVSIPRFSLVVPNTLN